MKISSETHKPPVQERSVKTAAEKLCFITIHLMLFQGINNSSTPLQSFPSKDFNVNFYPAS